MEIIFGRNAGKRIVLVGNGAREPLRRTAHKISCILFVVDRYDERKRIDKHAHRIADLQVASAV